MTRVVARVAGYRFRATFRHQAFTLVALAVLMALLGGIAMAALAGARRNQSAYPAFLASTNPSTLVLPTGIYAPQYGFANGYLPKIIARIKGLPGVRTAESAVQLNDLPVDAAGHPLRLPANFNVGTVASLDGYHLDEDRVRIVRGHALDPRRADEVVVSADVAKVLAADGIHVGDVMHLALLTNAQSSGSLDAALAHPYRRVTVRLVGIGITSIAVIQDDVDVIGSAFFMFSPAFTREFVDCCAQSTVTGLQLAGGARAVPATEAAIEKINPLLNRFESTALPEAKVERAVKPASIAFAGFGLVALLAALLIAGQVIGRAVRAGANDTAAMRALGADPRMTLFDPLVGVFGAIVAGAALACAVAVALSPRAPFGAVRRVAPHGMAVDSTVLGLGAAVLVVGLGVIALVLAFRNAPHRVAARRRVARGASPAAGLAVSAGAPVSLVAGARFALDSGRSSQPVPARSALLGAFLAVVVVVGSLTFGASLHTLVSRPRLYGWNWTYALSAGSGVGAVPQHQSATLLRHDHDVAAESGYYFATVAFAGHEEPVLAGVPGTAVQPPVLAGHGLEAADQVVLGAATLAQLHAHLGQRISMTGGVKPVTLRIVGTATMPAVGAESDPLHPTMGTGALIASSLLPASVRDAVGNTPTGPNMTFVRIRAGADPAAARTRLDRIAAKLTLPTNYGVEVLGAQRPAEIVNYKSMSNTPLDLGVGLALGAVGALALTLIASVRRRRRELALLKTLGFTRRQLAAVVAWQSTIAVGVGVVLGVPMGIVVGRALWITFAHDIHAVPAPTVPALAIVIVAIGALVLANLVAAVPGRQAARTPTALLLHAE